MNRGRRPWLRLLGRALHIARGRKLPERITSRVVPPGTPRAAHGTSALRCRWVRSTGQRGRSVPGPDAAVLWTSGRCPGSSWPPRPAAP